MSPDPQSTKRWGVNRWSFYFVWTIPLSRKFKKLSCLTRNKSIPAQVSETVNSETNTLWGLELRFSPFKYFMKRSPVDIWSNQPKRLFELRLQNIIRTLMPCGKLLLYQWWYPTMKTDFICRPYNSIFSCLLRVKPNKLLSASLQLQASLSSAGYF